jgi:hypothetical protein
MLFFQLAEAFRRIRVLHRLLMPRHPPVALNSLTKKNLLQAVSLSYDFYLCPALPGFRQLILKIFLKRRFLSVIYLLQISPLFGS